jgi:hypothetical protein
VQTREGMPEPDEEMPAGTRRDAEKMGRSQDGEKSRESHRSRRSRERG